MTFAEGLAVTIGVASIVLAMVAMWLALHHKRESDRTNDAVRSLLLEVKSDAKTIAGVVLPELQKYGDAVRSTVFFQKAREADTTTISATAASYRDAGATLQRFYEVVGSIRDGSGFTNKQRDEAMALARKCRTNDGLADDEEFVTTLEQLIDSFAAGDQSLHVDSLAELFQDIVQNSTGIIHTMVISLGMRLLEVPHPSQKTEDQFSDYAALARQHGLEEVVMPFSLVHAHRRGESQQLTTLLEEMRAWDGLRVHQVAEAIERRTDPARIGRGDHPKIQAVAQINHDFWSRYQGKLKALYE